MIVFPVTNLVRGGRAGIRTRPCALPPALPFLLSLRVLRPSRPPPFSRRSIPLSSPPRTSPSSLLRRVESPPDVPSSGSQLALLLRVEALSPCRFIPALCSVHGIIGVSWPLERRPPRCHVPANSLTTLTIRIPRGRRGLVDNWRRARANCRFFDILYGRGRATRLSRDTRVSRRGGGDRSWMDGWMDGASPLMPMLEILGEVHDDDDTRWNKSSWGGGGGGEFFSRMSKVAVDKRVNPSPLPRVPPPLPRPYEIFHGYMERQRYIFCRINALPEVGR